MVYVHYQGSLYMLETSDSLVAKPHRIEVRLISGRIVVGILAAVALFFVTQASGFASDPVDLEVAGTIRNSDGHPIPNAWITDGESYTFSDQQGIFHFSNGKVLPGDALIISSAGYQQELVVAPNNGQAVDVVMSSYSVRGIYFNPRISNNPATVANYIHIAKTTEVNAVVIDVKEDVVYFDTENPLFQEANMILPILDLPWLLEEFRSNGIYTIARIVVFKDSPVAELHPEYAVRDSFTGGLWRDQNGAAWVNPMSRPMWEANISLAEEVIHLGFDEVQYDYIRFPTDGNMARADFGGAVTAFDRESAIEDFLQISRDRLIPLGGRQSADVFGYTTVIDHDLGIGQNFEQVSEKVDYISPMIYPSHWPKGSLYGIAGHPNESPYLTVHISMNEAVKQLNGNRLQLRPWLQDFGMHGMRTYGAADVRAQIDALNDLGINNWLIWSPSNFFHTAAFTPDSTLDVLPTAEPKLEPLIQPAQSSPRSRLSPRTWPTVSH